MVLKISEFPDNGWNFNSLNYLLQDSSSTARWPESEQHRSTCTDENVDAVNDLVLSQIPKETW